MKPPNKGPMNRPTSRASWRKANTPARDSGGYQSASSEFWAASVARLTPIAPRAMENSNRAGAKPLTAAHTPRNTAPMATMRVRLTRSERKPIGTAMKMVNTPARLMRMVMAVRSRPK